jgi:Protein of unknown function (DUF2500)
MANKHKIPADHPMLLVSYGIMVFGILLFLSNFFFMSQGGDTFTFALRGFGGMGLIIFGSVLRGLVERSWNDSQPVLSLHAKVVSKWTDGGDSATYYARFETDSGEILEFSLQLEVFKRFAERDSGTLIYQGTRVHNFHRE